MITVPMAFLFGIGCFDYWLRWASGAPTIPEDHSGHGATKWQDYFRVNTDHKVIGIQYIVTTFFFFIIGGVLAMVIRGGLAGARGEVVGPKTLHRRFFGGGAPVDFLFLNPGFGGPAELR